MKKKIIGLGLLWAIGMACKKQPDPEPTFVPPDSSFGLIYDKILVTNCGLSGCHADESHKDHGHALTLKGAGTYASLINTNPKNSQALAAGLKNIAPGDTAKSFVYQKLIYNRSIHKYGAPMPLGGLKLTAKQIEFVKLWIAAGAPEKGHVIDKNLIN